MSRIGKQPVPLTDNVEFSIGQDNVVTIKGEKGTSTLRIHPDIKIESRDNEIQVIRTNDSKEQKSLHGLYRSLIYNMVEGVSKGYEIKQELVGVGFRAEARGQMLELSVGYSHDIHFEIPREVEVETKTERRSNPVITLKSIDKQLVGQVAAKIRSFRKPEPYKGKGIKFVGEQLRKKAGKSASV